MKKYLVLPLLFMLAVALLTPLAFSQNMGSVKGVCKDEEGKPIVGAEVEWLSTDTGHKYTLKTDKNGNYFSLGIVPGKYNVKLSKDGKEIYHLNGITVSLDEADVDFDLKKERASQAAGQGKTTEQLKAEQEQQAKVKQEQTTVASLNSKLKDARDAASAGDFEKAISILNDANAIDANRDPIWATLADDYRFSAPKQTDPDEKKKRYDMAAVDYQKAIDLRKASPQAEKDPNNNKTLAGYYNNMGDAYSRENKIDDASKAYEQAAQLAPENAATYYFNEGAVLTNAGRADDANVAFDKAIAADPKKAMAYYQKGINLLGKATLGKDNKMVVPDGTVEAFQKYLELDPNGSMAQNAKDMLATIGATVETGFGTKKKPAKK